MLPEHRLGRPPAAARFEPPVHKLTWVTSSEMSAEAFLASARAHGGWGDATWQGLLWHGGLHVNRRRFLGPSRFERIPANATVVAYWFSREPEPVPVGPEAVLLDEHGVVAVNKPAWLPHQGTRASARFSLEETVRALVGCAELRSLHRLDRNTSGVCVFARDSATAARLSAQFRSGQVHKEYLALVSPPPASEHWSVSGYLVQAPHPHHAYYGFRAEPIAGGRLSSTEFVRLAVGGERAVVRAIPRTGRTHQIRIHLAESGSPIVGDTLYGRPYAPQTPWSAERLQLHARRLALRVEPGPHAPRVSIQAALPNDWLGGRVNDSEPSVAD